MSSTYDEIQRVFGIPTESLLIGGSWTRSRAGKTFDVIDPGNGQVITQVAEGTADDVNDAVSAARASFDSGSWRDLPGATRGIVLWKVAELLEQHQELIATVESLNQGMPVSRARHSVLRAAQGFRYYAGWADKIHGHTADVHDGATRFHAYTLREPVGVAALIVPWNAPITMATWKLAPALVVGCSVILKPAEETPLTGLILGALLKQAGVPAGVVNVVTGFGDVAGEALTTHPDVDKVSFTGSVEIGKHIVRAAAGNLKKLTLELGGKSPVVVLADADLTLAIPGASRAIFNNAGQTCAAGSRLFVEDRVYEQVVEGVAAFGKALKVGYSMDPESEMGPLISAKQLRQVTGFVDEGLADGAQVVTGGQQTGDSGYFMEPTVMRNVHPSMRMVREEIFGPVVAAMSFDDLDAVIATANDTKYGLAASVWTQDVGRAHAVASRIRAGRVGINVHSPGDYQMPTGGYKESGWGREHGPEGVSPYLEVKSVFTRLA